MMNKTQMGRGWALAGMLVAVVAQTAWGQSKKPELPSQPTSWLNAPPLKWDMMKGKGVVFYFFEEDCPRCKGEWPGILAEVEKFKGKPVAFIGVNSGNSAAEVAAYAREIRCNWPISVDTDRSFETAAGVPPLSLQNIWQYMVLTPEGEFRRSRGFDMAKAGEDALTGAKWNIDPSEIPAAMQPAWIGVEFGNYAAAAIEVQKNLKSPKPELKAAAEKLNAYVQGEIQKRIESANSSQQAGEKWAAYKLYSSLSQEFKGFTIPPEAEKAAKDLSLDDGVKVELAAIKRYDIAYKQLTSPTPSVQKRGRSLLEVLAKDSPSTEAGKKALDVIKQLP